MEKITQNDIDNLADVIWWIKGFRSASDEAYANCPFDDTHAEALRKARINLMTMNEGGTCNSCGHVHCEARSTCSILGAIISTCKDWKRK